MLKTLSNNRLFAIESLVQELIAKIDGEINKQLNKVIHHKKLQKMEALWRGAHYLITIKNQLNNRYIKIKILPLSALELIKDISSAVDFDQSQLFKKVYSDEFDMSGGEPYSLIIADYSISHTTFDRINVDSVHILTELARIAAASFSPIIMKADSWLFGLDNFTKLEKDINLIEIFSQLEYQRWNDLRRLEDSRFLGVVLPQTLIRSIKDRYAVTIEFSYANEKINKHDDYLWGHAGFCFAEIIMKAFSEIGWFLNTRDGENAGFISGLSQESFTATRGQNFNKYITEINILDKKEDILNALGFMVLISRNIMNNSTFYQMPSLQKIKNNNVVKMNEDANLAIKLNHILCASRFAHYIKIIIRNKIGTFIEPQKCQEYLCQWIAQYCASNSSNKIDYPLRNATIKIEEKTADPGKYMCKIDLVPHYQLDTIQSSIKLKSYIKLKNKR